MLTVEQVQQVLPANLKNAATQQFVDMVNTCVSDPEVAEQVRNNFISYTSVLKTGKFKTEDYLHAVMFVSYKLMGMSNNDAYMRAFPHRYGALQAKGTSSKDISAYVSAYARGKLVNLVLEQSLVPSWVLNQDIYQRAINTQLELMTDIDVSAKVRCDAANSILTHLKKPEVGKFQLDVSVQDNSGMNELKETLVRLAQQQQHLITQGVSVKEIAAAPLIEAKAVEIP